jgi:hypothetical protein
MIRVNVEGNPEEVASFFKEMGKVSTFEGAFGLATANFDVDKATVESVEIEPSELTEAQKEVAADLVETDPKVIEKVTGKKPGRPKKEKAVEPEVVTPDPEFSDLPDVAENATTEVLEVAEEPEKSSVTREMVQAALKEYGIWLQQTGEVKQGQVRSYLYALTKKFGNGVSGTPDLEEQYFEAVVQAAVSRVPVSELEEYL